MSEIIINPGECYVSKNEAETVVLKDLCGSLSVSMHDSANAIGGIAYILLPQPPPDHKEGGPQFATTAIPDLYGQLLKEGAAQGQVAVKLVGGSCFMGSGIFSIGKRNVARAKEVLGEMGLAIAGEDTGGEHKRNLKFNIKTGVLSIENIAK